MEPESVLQTLTSTEKITLAAALLTFVVGVVNLYFIFMNTRKTLYINTITASRIKHIKDLRDVISNYCGLIYQYNLLIPQLAKEKIDALNVIDQLRHSIKLYLNPEDKHFDRIIVTLVDDIYKNIDKSPTVKIEELVIATNYLFKLEWEGIKLESRKGELYAWQKKRLYNRILKSYTKARLKTLTSI